jgi:hypothetical protein
MRNIMTAALSFLLDPLTGTLVTVPSEPEYPSNATGIPYLRTSREEMR